VCVHWTATPFSFGSKKAARDLSTQMLDPSLVGAVAREVVEKYGNKIMEHLVGTGPFIRKTPKPLSI